jgi:hypothetical protein
LTILGHSINEKSKERWLRIVVFTVDVMFAWYSRRSYPSMISLFHLAILVFETVIVNEGKHYDLYDGVFVAPQKGFYLFSWTVSGYSTNYIVSKERWLRIVVFTVDVMFAWYSRRSYPSMISLFHLTKSSHRSWRILSASIPFAGRRNCIQSRDVLCCDKR